MGNQEKKRDERYDERVDAYIAKAEPFARPILTYLRELAHKGCPEVQETIKWGFPTFEYKGLLFGMASFKRHCTFGFWKGSLLKDPHHYLSPRSSEGGEAMGNFGRLTSVRDLPPNKAMLDFVKQARQLNVDGVKVPPKPKPKMKEAVVPPYFLAALKKNKKAQNAFESFSPSHRREYVEWITEAKIEETRQKRMQQALEWMAEGKSRNWKYTPGKK